MGTNVNKNQNRLRCIVDYWGGGGLTGQLDNYFERHIYVLYMWFFLHNDSLRGLIIK